MAFHEIVADAFLTILFQFANHESSPGLLERNLEPGAQGFIGSDALRSAAVALLKDGFLGHSILVQPELKGSFRLLQLSTQACGLFWRQAEYEGGG